MEETTDEWTIRSEEEELVILYADWESDFAWTEEMEETTKAVCLHCGNALIPDPSLLGRLLPLRMYCGVCE